MTRRNRPAVWGLTAPMAINLARFALIPSLIVWSVILTAASGDLIGALQIACVGVAAGFVGWSLGTIEGED